MTNPVDFAERMGRATRALVDRPDVAASIEARLSKGATVEDAVLGQVHAHLAKDAELANEFLSCLLDESHLLGRAALGRGHLRRHLDSEDLVQSVMGDLGHRLGELEFRSKREFLSLLAQRMRWKAVDRHRALDAGMRREDRRSPCSPSEMQLSDERPSPLSFLSSEDECAQLALALARLPKRDASILRAALRGASTEDLAAEFSLTPQAAKRARTRAVQRARDMLIPTKETDADASDTTTS